MWVVLFGFGTFFLNYATLVPVGEGMGLTTVTAGSILTIMMVAVVGVQPVASMLNSRFGPRHALGIALILQGISNIVGLVDGSPIAVLLTASIIGGLGFGVLVVSGTAVVPSTVVPSRLGRALGYFGATTDGATALGAPTGLWLIEVIPPVGLRWVGCVLIVVALPALLLIPKTQRSLETSASEYSTENTGSLTGRRFSGLVIVLLPVAIAMTAFGLILAFGPLDNKTSAAEFIVTMQVLAIIGRFLASSALDHRTGKSVMVGAIILALIGLASTALLSGGLELYLAMVVLGFGIGSIQAASLVLCFEQAGNANHGSVAWNMTFDIGLGFAGLVGGFGFTYWGAAATYGVCATALLLTGMLFVMYFRGQRRV